MKIIEFETLEDLQNYFHVNPVFVTMGAFDAVHKGHQYLINKTVEASNKKNVSSGLITFHTHPRSIIQTSKSSSMIFPLKKKLKLLEKLKIDALFLIHFNEDIKNLSHIEFFHSILLKHLNVKGFIIGENFCFGKDRKGDIPYLKKESAQYLDYLEIVSLLSEELAEVSTSSIKDLLNQGEIEKVNQYLGRNYSIEGEVIKGDGRGKTLGFPTLNLPPQSSFIPRAGVYITTTTFDKKFYSSITNIGTKPTFNFSNPIQEYTIETHLLDYEKMIPIDHIKVDFHQFIRDEVQFENQEALIEQIKTDISKAKVFHKS